MFHVHTGMHRFFFFNDTATTEIYTLSLHDALPISRRRRKALDLTQEALAQAVSCSRFAIRKIEADERRPSRRLAERLADKLGIPEPEREAFLDAARSLRAAEGLVLDGIPLASEHRDTTPFVGRGAEFGLLIGLLARL